MGKKDLQILLIFDDIIASLRKHQYTNELKELFFNRRHLIKDGSMSIITTTQRYMVCPPVIRTTLTSMFVFKCNRNEWLTIKKENVF
jgi:hypothetical protein